MVFFNTQFSYIGFCLTLVYSAIITACRLPALLIYPLCNGTGKWCEKHKCAKQSLTQPSNGKQGIGHLVVSHLSSAYFSSIGLADTKLLEVKTSRHTLKHLSGRTSRGQTHILQDKALLLSEIRQAMFVLPIFNRKNHNKVLRQCRLVSNYNKIHGSEQIVLTHTHQWVAVHVWRDGKKVLNSAFCHSS